MTQTETLQLHFAKRRTIDKVFAEQKYGIKSLSRRIVDLKEMGYNFEHRRKITKDGRQMTTYRLVG